MGFSKKDYSPEIAIAVTHAWYPGEVFTFYFPKLLPQAALDANKAFVGLPEDEREEALRLAIIDAVAKMTLRAPDGFSDFQGPGHDSLEVRMKSYFDDPSKPELEAIILSVWSAYRVAALPSAYLKSVSNNGARSGGLSHAASSSASTL